MASILAVATNDATELNGKRTGLWLSELTHFLDVVERAGFGYDIASPKGGTVPLDAMSTAKGHDRITARYMADPEFKRKLENSMKCNEVDVSRYAAIFLAGGHGAMFDFRHSPDLQGLITRFQSANKVLSGVCHGVSGFVDSVDESGNLLVRGKTMTGFSNFEDMVIGAKKLMPFLLQDELQKNGATYRKNIFPFTARVEVDGRLITGQNPQSTKQVAEKLVERLKGL